MDIPNNNYFMPVRCTKGFTCNDLYIYVCIMSEVLKRPFYIVRGHQHNNEEFPFSSTNNLCTRTSDEKDTQSQSFEQTSDDMWNITDAIHHSIREHMCGGISTWTSAPAYTGERFGKKRIFGPGCGFGMVDFKDTTPPQWYACWDNGHIRDKQRASNGMHLAATQPPPPMITTTNIAELSTDDDSDANDASMRYVQYTKVDEQISKVGVIGDLHGNWDGFLWNLRKMMTDEVGLLQSIQLEALHSCNVKDWFMNIRPRDNAALVFTGDFLDRGQHGLPILCILYGLARQHPSQIFVCRGNHDFDDSVEKPWDRYGFDDELRTHFSDETEWHAARSKLTEVMQKKPSVHMLVHSGFVMQCHHGLSIIPIDDEIEDINKQINDTTTTT